jgi:DNA-binding transcriptional LysR family regulator
MPDDAPDLDLRHLRSFVAVAEELHFGRAAARLHLTQPAISDHVRRLEELLDVALLHRTTRRVEVTAAGAVFLEDARRLLELAATAVRDARRAERGQIGRLRLGYSPGALMDVIRPVLDAFAEVRPDVEVLLRESGFTDPSGGLADGHADVAIIRPPISAHGVEWAALAHDERVALLPAGHRLAGEESIAVADLVDEAWLYADTDPAWRAFWCAERERGAPPRYAGTIDSMEGLFEGVRGGIAVALVPASVERTVRWEGVRTVPVRDLAPAEIAVAWRAHDENPLVRAFVAVARRVWAAPDS